MRAAMADAVVGDDVLGEDPTVVALERRVADLLGHEAALFTPTGSMANQLGVRLLVRPGQELLCDTDAHVVRAELGAAAALSGITTRTWISPRGRVDAAAVDVIGSLMRPDAGPYFVSTVRRGRGEHPQLRRWHRPAARPAAAAARRSQSDAGRGAAPRRRPAVERARRQRRRARRRTAGCSTPSRSACPRASVRRSGRCWPPRQTRVAEARVWRKRLGGGMRQVGILAAAGLHALDHHLDRLADDHRRARRLAECSPRRLPGSVDPATVETNIVVLETADAPALVAALPRAGRAGRACSTGGTCGPSPTSTWATTRWSAPLACWRRCCRGAAELSLSPGRSAVPAPRHGPPRGRRTAVGGRQGPGTRPLPARSSTPSRRIDARSWESTRRRASAGSERRTRRSEVRGPAHCGDNPLAAFSHEERHKDRALGGQTGAGSPKELDAPATAGHQGVRAPADDDGVAGSGLCWERVAAADEQTLPVPTAFQQCRSRPGQAADAARNRLRHIPARAAPALPGHLRHRSPRSARSMGNAPRSRRAPSRRARGGSTDPRRSCRPRRRPRAPAVCRSGARRSAPSCPDRASPARSRRTERSRE